MILSKKPIDISYVVLLIVSASGYFLIGKVPRDNSATLSLIFFVLFFTYVLWVVKPPSSKYNWALGLTVRLAVFFSLPSLSDDFYRFLWDGSLLQKGINPYLVLPSKDLLPSSHSLFSGLNSAKYYTVYPPLNQLLFWIASFFKGPLAGVNFIRATLILADILTFYFLTRIVSNDTLANWYWLNPLVVLEFTGNLHMEGWVICGLTGAIYFTHKSKAFVAGLFMGLAIGMKIIPVLLVPVFFLSRFIKDQGAGIFVLGVSLVSFSLLPQILALISAPEIFSSFTLYFTSFEFNASLYFLARAWGYWSTGYNLIHSIGPKLALSNTFIIIIIYILSYLGRIKLTDGLLFILFTYLIFSTTVHPWYIVPLIPLGIIGGWYFPLVWSGLVTVTYFGYTESGYDLPAFWLFLEYGLVFPLVIYEVWGKYVASKKLPNFDSHLTS